MWGVRINRRFRFPENSAGIFFFFCSRRLVQNRSDTRSSDTARRFVAKRSFYFKSVTFFPPDTLNPNCFGVFQATENGELSYAE